MEPETYRLESKNGQHSVGFDTDDERFIVLATMPDDTDAHRIMGRLNLLELMMNQSDEDSRRTRAQFRLLAREMPQFLKYYLDHFGKKTQDELGAEKWKACETARDLIALLKTMT